MSAFRAQSLPDSVAQIDVAVNNSNESKQYSPTTKKKSVTFSPDTYFSDEYNIFVSISNHGYLKEAGHTIYTIKVSKFNVNMKLHLLISCSYINQNLIVR